MTAPPDSIDRDYKCNWHQGDGKKRTLDANGFALGGKRENREPAKENCNRER